MTDPIHSQPDTANREASDGSWRSSAHAGASRGRSSASEQLAASARAVRQYVEEPRKRRVAEREAVVEHRERYRLSTDYGQLHEELQRALRAYGEDWSFGDLGREFYVAGVSGVLPRRRNERCWVLGEDARRCQRRVELIERAKRLDGIDAVGGFDSAAEYDFSLQGPAPGDNHTNRTWQAILQADTRLLANVISCRRTNWGPWLRRLILRWSVPVVFLVLGVAMMVMTDESAWWAVAWIATMCSIVAITWTYPKRKDAFIQAVDDISSDHVRARGELMLHLHSAFAEVRPSSGFVRDPSMRPLSDLLLGETLDADTRRSRLGLLPRRRGASARSAHSAYAMVPAGHRNGPRHPHRRYLRLLDASCDVLACGSRL